MYVLGVVGPDAATGAVVDELAERLREDGRVATVVNDAVAGDNDAPTEAETRGGEEASVHETGPEDASYHLSADGWSASGRERSRSDVLADLAPDYDYAILAGFPDAKVPQVVVGDGAEGSEVEAGENEVESELRETLLEVEDADALDPAEVVSKLRATQPYETLESLVARAKASADAPYSGAIATFTGRVRAKEDAEDSATEYLDFEKYEGVAEQRMAAIGEELTEREGVFEVLLHHRTGVIEYGEDIVFVVVLAGHREEAFRTVEDGIDRLKDEVPIFKKEVTTDEQFWVHERQ